MPLAQKHYETIGSAQVKSAILLAALNTPGITKVEIDKHSRNHTENLLTSIRAQINIKKIKKGRELITLKGQKDLFGFNIAVPGDASSAAPFIALTLLTANSKLLIKNVNCNSTRMGFVKILKKMNASINIKNIKIRSGEPTGDILIKSSSLRSIKCSKNLVPFAIDEFPLLFILASITKGKSEFNGIKELRHKESDRIKNIEIGLNKIGIKTKSNLDKLIIFGNPKLKIKNILKIDPKGDHRIAMAFFCLAQLINGEIVIKNFETVNTSFPKFLFTMKKIGGNFEVKKNS